MLHGLGAAAAPWSPEQPHDLSTPFVSVVQALSRWGRQFLEPFPHDFICALHPEVPDRPTLRSGKQPGSEPTPLEPNHMT